MFYSVCKEVKVSVGEIVNYTLFFIIETGDNQVLLGTLFVYNTELTLRHSETGRKYAEFKNYNKMKIKKVTVVTKVIYSLLQEDKEKNQWPAWDPACVLTCRF